MPRLTGPRPKASAVPLRSGLAVAMGSVVDLASEYFNSPDMKTDEALERFAAILASGK